MRAHFRMLFGMLFGVLSCGARAADTPQASQAGNTDEASDKIDQALDPVAEEDTTPEPEEQAKPNNPTEDHKDNHNDSDMGWGCPCCGF